MAMTGEWPNYYLNAWELDADRNWQPTSDNNMRSVPVSSLGQSPPKDQVTTLRHLFCTLIPNEHAVTGGNGLNVLMVSSYGEHNQFINFRTFIKAGTKVDTDVLEGTTPGDKPAATTSPQPVQSTTPASSYNWVVVNWDSGFASQDSGLTSLVPSWCFTPPEQARVSGQAKLVHPTSDDSLKGKAAGRNSWSTYDQWGSISSTFGDDNRALSASKPVPSPGEGSIEMSLVACYGLEAGSVVPLPSPYVPSPSSSGAITDFDETSTLSGCGRYQAIEQDVSKIQPVAIIKGGGPGRLCLWKPNGADRLSQSYAISGHEDHIDPIWVSNDWWKDLETEYYFDTVTNKPTAVMFMRGREARYRILNPGYLFRISHKPPPDKSSLPQPTPAATLPMEPPINQTSTAKPPTIKQSRPPAGWSQCVDYPVADNFGAHNNFHSMGWRLCKVASTVRKMPQYGIMQIFSFHGVIGVRVWAPRESGEYSLWVPRGMNPYLGQTSLGKLKFSVIP